MEYIITFASTNFAIKAEQCLLGQGLHVTVLPLPSQIRAGCGICLRVPKEALRPALQALAEQAIADAGIYERALDDRNAAYREVNKRMIEACDNSRSMEDEND